MNKSKNILVTTTSSLEGWKITNYLGIVTSHVVAGTGFFSDFKAGLSDIFGGRSETYRKQLESIDNEAIAELKSKAAKLGGNALIGLRIDHDEIGGQNKQMFMCTAQATAVYATGPETENGQSLARSNYVDASSLRNLQKRKEILERLNSPSATLPYPKELPYLQNDEWKFLSEQRAIEFLPWVIEKLADQNSRNQSIVFPASFVNDANGFISLLNSDETQGLICRSLATAKDPRSLISIIDALNLLDLSVVKSLLDSQDFVIAKRAVMLIQCNKSAYTHSDLNDLIEIKDKINSRFLQLEFSTTKSLFGGTSEVWKCPSCARAVESKNWLCQCSTDWYGFTNDEPRKLEALANLDKRISLLKELLGA
jgi:uncharacterized protein YbjQ (UPF0145 family)